MWGRVDELPESLNRDMLFFEQALEEKVITVPGRFFDIDPGNVATGVDRGLINICVFPLVRPWTF